MGVFIVIVLAGCTGETEQPAKREGFHPPPIRQPEQQAQRPVQNKPVEKSVAIPQGSRFDFYVLSLSWSPNWCGQNDPSGKSQQCAADKRHGFIVHGLWPQNENGYPESCASEEPDRVPDALGRTLFDIMPSMGLIGHEWRKHGVCSDLGQRDYFAVLRAAWEKIRLPPVLQAQGTQKRLRPADIEAAFLSSNPGLTESGMAVSCQAGQLDEVRICLTKSLGFRACGDIDRAGCRSPSIALPVLP